MTKTDTSTSLTALTRRERHIMDILFRLGRATADEVMLELAGKRSYSTVRTQLRVLEQKGYGRHEERGRQFVYTPTVPLRSARKSALRHVMDTFFDGSVEEVVAALLGGEAARVSGTDLDRIVELVSKARGSEKARGR
jgi:BlaI family transcriptional regulator, penicillinase repressor